MLSPMGLMAVIGADQQQISLALAAQPRPCDGLRPRTVGLAQHVDMGGRAHGNLVQRVIGIAYPIKATAGLRRSATSAQKRWVNRPVAGGIVG